MRLFVQQDGRADAPPPVLVHGFSSSGRSFDALTRALADAFRVVRPDLLGHGRTGGRAAGADEQAVAVRRVLADLDLQDVTLVGHSLGADVALGASVDHRVARVAVLAQAPDLSDAGYPRATSVMAVPLVGAALHRAATRPVVQHVGTVAFAPGHRTSPAEREQAFADLRAMHPGTYREVLVARRRRLAADPLDAQLGRLGKPSLVVLGGADRFYGDRSASRYRAAGAEVVVLPAAGHSVQAEAPAEVSAILREWVTRRSPGGPTLPA